MKLNLFLEMSFWGQIFIFKTARILTHIWKGLLLPSIWLLRLKKSQNSSNFPFWSRSNFRAFYSYWMEYEINSSILNNICWENSLTILKANLFRNISEPAFMLFLTRPYYCLHWSIPKFYGFGKVLLQYTERIRKKKDQGNSKDLLKVQTVTLTSVLAR